MRERYITNQQYINSYSDQHLLVLDVKEFVTLVAVQVSSTGEGKIKVLVNGAPIMTYLVQKYSNLYVPLRLHLEPGDILQLVGNTSNVGSDFNSTIIYSDDQEAWNNNFIQELDKTLTT